MNPTVVTFDCANTLVRVRWTPGGFALECARSLGLALGEPERAAYDRALRSRWGEYRALNLLRDPSAADAFWHELTGDWLVSIGENRKMADRLIEIAPKLLYEGSDWFELFDDVIPTLDMLGEAGIRLGVISNWDYSLHRVLRSKGIYDRFEHVVASLEEGVEKPDARLFQLTLEKFGVAAGEVLHIGDDPVDDLRGAQDVGLRAMLIARSHEESCEPYLARLQDVEMYLTPSTSENFGGVGL